MSYVRTFDNFSPPKRFDSIPFVTVEIKESATSTGTFTTIDTQSLVPVDSDPAEPISRDFTTALAQLDPAWYILVWTDSSLAFFPSKPISSLRPGFATAHAVEIRMGRDLTDSEQELAESVIAQVTGLITEAAGQNDAWAAGLNPVPAYYKALCVEKALAVFSNPQQAISEMKQLGQYQHAVTFRRGDIPSDLFLTEYEERMVRRIANNEVSRSVRTRSLVHDIYVTEP